MQTTKRKVNFEELFLCVVKFDNSSQKEILIEPLSIGKRPLKGCWESCPKSLIRRVSRFAENYYIEKGKYPRYDYTLCVCTHSDALGRFGEDFEFVTFKDNRWNSRLRKWAELIAKNNSFKQKSKKTTADIIDEYLFGDE